MSLKMFHTLGGGGGGGGGGSEFLPRFERSKGELALNLHILTRQITPSRPGLISRSRRALRFGRKDSALRTLLLLQPGARLACDLESA